MKAEDNLAELIPPVLLAEVEAMAAAEHRAPREVVGEAVERFVRERQPLPRSKLTPQEAGERIRELRKGNFLPEGETIKSLINFGRA
jgi:hypothetical protein